MRKDYARMIGELQNKLNRITQENSKIEGEISATMKKLKKDYDIDSIQEAKEYRTKLNGEITKHISEVESEIYEIKEILDVGGSPIVQNICAPIVKNLVGQYWSSRQSPVAVARKQDASEVSSMLSLAIERAVKINDDN